MSLIEQPGSEHPSCTMESAVRRPSIRANARRLLNRESFLEAVIVAGAIGIALIIAVVFLSLRTG